MAKNAFDTLKEMSEKNMDIRLSNTMVEAHTVKRGACCYGSGRKSNN